MNMNMNIKLGAKLGPKAEAKLEAKLEARLASQTGPFCLLTFSPPPNQPPSISFTIFRKHLSTYE